MIIKCIFTCIVDFYHENKIILLNTLLFHLTCILSTTEHFKAIGLKGDPYAVNLYNLEASRKKFHSFIPSC